MPRCADRVDRLFGLQDEAEILLCRDAARAFERRALVASGVLQSVRACGSLARSHDRQGDRVRRLAGAFEMRHAVRLLRARDQAARRAVGSIGERNIPKGAPASSVLA
jgi:hypothetical protein